MAVDLLIMSVNSVVHHTVLSIQCINTQCPFKFEHNPDYSITSKISYFHRKTIKQDITVSLQRMF